MKASREKKKGVKSGRILHLKDEIHKERRESKAAKYYLVRAPQLKIEKLWLGTEGRFKMKKHKGK